MDDERVSEAVRRFLVHWRLPAPQPLSQADSETHESVEGERHCALIARGNAGAFLVSRAALQAASTLVRELVVDSDDDDRKTMEIPIAITSATMPSLSLVASWLASPSALLEPPSVQVPRHDSEVHPGTTGEVGKKIIEMCLKDPWVQQTLVPMFPARTTTLRIFKTEVERSQRSGRDTSADGSDTFTPTGPAANVDVTLGIRGLAMLHHVSLIAMFLRMRRLVELIAGYVLHVFKEVIRDERAFGVSERRKMEVANVPLGAFQPPVLQAITWVGRTDPLFMVEVVERSWQDPPVEWNAEAAPLDEYFAHAPREALEHIDSSDKLLQWLRDSCTNAPL